MNSIKSRIKTKYILFEHDDQTLHDYLDDENNYREFIQNLSNIMITEPTYVYFIYGRSDFIVSEIEIHKENRKSDIYEKFIEKKLKNIELFSGLFKWDFKSQYIYFYLCNINLPYALRSENLFNKMIKENYENCKKIEKIINNDADSRKSLKGNMSFLLTINSILFEDCNINDSLLSLFIEISSLPVKREDFEDNRSYQYYKIYRYKTMNKLKQMVEEKNENPKIKSKTLY